jgi:dihydroxyacetone kinase-like protein
MAEPVLDGALVTRWFEELRTLVTEAEQQLTELDAAIGDADHGTNMTRGLRATVRALAERPGLHPAAAFGEVGAALTAGIAGAAGPLYGTIFTTLGGTLPDGPELALPEFVDGLRAGLRSVQELGAAELGDKTMIDAIAPAVDELARQAGAGASLSDAAGAAADAAEDGAVATIPLRARKGRASYLGPRSEGHQDPGATSSALMFRALSRVTRVA